jgi:hypothetical protein
MISIGLTGDNRVAVTLMGDAHEPLVTELLSDYDHIMALAVTLSELAKIVKAYGDKDE